MPSDSQVVNPKAGQRVSGARAAESPNTGGLPLGGAVPLGVALVVAGGSVLVYGLRPD